PPPHSRILHSFPTRRSSDLRTGIVIGPRSSSINLSTRCPPTNPVPPVTTTGDLFRTGLVSFSRGRSLLTDAEGDQTRSKKIPGGDRKSTRLNSSHVKISYAV